MFIHIKTEEDVLLNKKKEICLSHAAKLTEFYSYNTLERIDSRFVYLIKNSLRPRSD